MNTALTKTGRYPATCGDTLFGANSCLNVTHEIFYTSIGLISLLAITALVTIDFGRILIGRIRLRNPRTLLEDGSFLLIVHYLMWGSLGTVNKDGS